MRVVQVCHRYHPYVGGVETNVKEVSERLAKKGFMVEVLTTDPTGELPNEEVIFGVKVKRFKSWAPNEAYFFSKGLKRYLANKSINYDIVHAHNYHAFPALFAAQSKDENRLVFTPHYHGGGHTLFRNLLHVPYKFIARKAFEKADRIICVSNYEKKLVINDFKFEEEKVSLIPNGLNLGEFRRLKERKGCSVILYVGRLEKYKGVDYIIRAMPFLSDDITLEIIGKGSYAKHLVKLANRLKLMFRVKFYQSLPRDKLLLKYANADLFVLLSKYEAFSISVAEALAAKTPCIVANTSAIKEWIDNKNCFGIDYPISIDELVRLINRVIGKVVEGVKLLSWDEVVERLVNLYSGCLQ